MSQPFTRPCFAHPLAGTTATRATWWTAVAAVGHARPCAMLAMMWCTQAAPASSVTVERERPGEATGWLEGGLGLPTQLASLWQT